MSNELAIEKSCMSKCSWRLLPYLLFMFVLCYIDRTNLGFAGLQMSPELGLTASTFGFGAGLFFIGYFIFEVPSNLCLAKFGARRWIARIMVTWGAVAALMCLINGTTSFLVMRFLLGASEAGFYPGVIYFIGEWFPNKYRAGALSRFNLAQPVALIFGSLLSGFLISALDGVMGYSGWRWLFLVEGVPTIIFGIVTLYYLTDKPADAQWLTEEERTWLMNRLATEAAAIKGANEDYTIGKALTHPAVLALGIAYFLAICEGVYGINMWIPQMLKQWSGMTPVEIGFIGALPFVTAFCCILLLGWSSQKHQERKWHLTFALMVGAIALCSSLFVTGTIPTMICVCLGCGGMFSAIPLFWTIPAQFLTGTAAATGIAVINSIGNLGGFFGPTAVGMVRDATGEFQYGLLLIGVSVFIGAVICHVLNNIYGKKVDYSAIENEAK